MWKTIGSFLHRLASPKYFFQISGKLVPWLAGLTVILLVSGLYLGLFVAPPDYQQGESYRIMFVHVPSAWMSLFVYVFMATLSAIHLIWNIKLAEVMVRGSAALGASFTFLALATGSLWGKPMWGAWWVWDARLTSELILLFLYLGYIALVSAIEEPRMAARAGAVLLLVGVVNIPIIHYSVEWWNTLHQGPTVTKFGKPSIHVTMLVPLLLMALAFQCYYFTVALLCARTELLERERRSAWVREMLAGSEAAVDLPRSG
ncbi:heme ABC transporter permease [Candidatus Methylocalor cossyra]|uniref:Heme exporter protein C n=1 Tax=Candidatus Methylocalor cossyra TaxID=3108543 RepID=A0ABP1C3R4_9GAMM